MEDGLSKCRVSDRFYIYKFEIFRLYKRIFFMRFGKRLDEEDEISNGWKGCDSDMRFIKVFRWDKKVWDGDEGEEDKVEEVCRSYICISWYGVFYC